jgi:hypothetical protein
MTGQPCTPNPGSPPGRRYPQGGWVCTIQRPGQVLAERGKVRGRGRTGKSVPITHATPPLDGRLGHTLSWAETHIRRQAIQHDCLPMQLAGPPG